MRPCYLFDMQTRCSVDTPAWISTHNKLEHNSQNIIIVVSALLCDKRTAGDGHPFWQHYNIVIIWVGFYKLSARWKHVHGTEFHIICSQRHRWSSFIVRHKNPNVWKSSILKKTLKNTSWQCCTNNPSPGNRMNDLCCCWPFYDEKLSPTQTSSD